jgi:tetratricopeptide (TPR) repeat protein
MSARVAPTFVLLAVAIAAIAVWPWYSARTILAAAPTPAPVLADYATRDETIAFYESRIRLDPADQISARLLAGQYMQRYREAGDVGDILRARAQGLRSLQLQPQNNAGADETIASADTALHRFREALHYESLARWERPDDTNALAQMASLSMELGEYDAARHDLRVLARMPETATTLAVRGRYDELTGRLDEARRLLTIAMQQADALMDNPAQSRAWYHMRRGELDFSAGDAARARQDERDAIAEFPQYEQAWRTLARFCWAGRDWGCTLDAAKNAVAIVPMPESLGYEADAERALGDREAAGRTERLIVAIERIGNAYHLSDRLLSVYYAEHRVRVNDALAIAERETALRGDEIYAQDTLAWAAAVAGDWPLAREAARRATRYGTQDPRIFYHAGVIAQHFGDRETARRDLSEALALNAQFDPFYGDDARRRLDDLREP